MIYSNAQLYSINSLISSCLDYIDNYATEILSTNNFLQLSTTALYHLIKRNSFCAPEIEIFKAVVNWIETNPEVGDSCQAILNEIRLPLIKLEDLLNIVRLSNLFGKYFTFFCKFIRIFYLEPEKILDAINDQSTKRKLELIYRGYLRKY